MDAHHDHHHHYHDNHHLIYHNYAIFCAIRWTLTIAIIVIAIITPSSWLPSLSLWKSSSQIPQLCHLMIIYIINFADWSSCMNKSKIHFYILKPLLALFSFRALMVLSSMIFGYQGGDIGDRGLNVIFWHNLNSFQPKSAIAKQK